MSGLAENKAVLVTGAASGIGRATAKLFAAQGATGVLVCDVDIDGAEQTAADIRAAGTDAVARAVDITDEAAWETRTYDRLSIWGHQPS